MSTPEKQHTSCPGESSRHSESDGSRSAHTACDRGDGNAASVGVPTDVAAGGQSDGIVQDIINENPMSIQLVDIDGYTIKVNPAHTRLFGSVPPREYSVFEDAQLVRCGFESLIARARAGELVRFPDFPYNAHEVSPDLPSVPVWIRMVIFPIRGNDGKPERFVLMHEDITERKQEQQEIERKNIELERLNIEKDKFFSIIAHDLRSPFTAFLGLTEVMAEGLNSMTLEQIQKIAVNLRNSASNLFRLLENLLLWSRVQRGIMEFFPENIPLADVVRDCRELLEGAAFQKDISVTCASFDSIRVSADREMLECILRNLLSNAIKFTRHSGSIAIGVAQDSEGMVRISFRDTGIGMTPEFISKLFRIDVSSGRKGTDGEPSTGLGLLLVREFVEMHGGTIGVESTVGQGSTFSFTLPTCASRGHVK